MIFISNKSAQDILAYLADYATTGCVTLRERELRRRARLLLNKLKYSIDKQIGVQKAQGGKLTDLQVKQAKCPILDKDNNNDVQA